MTSASRLFSRRRRSGRNAGDPLELESDFERDRDQLSLYNHRLPSRLKCPRSRLRHRDPPCDRRHGLGPGPSRAGYLCQFASPQEHHLFSPDNTGTTESSTSRRSESEITSITTTGLTNNRNDRLPGAVLQAQARLLERLRGVPLIGNRQRTPIDAVSWDGFSFSDDLSVTNSGGQDSDALLEWFEFGPPHREPSIQESPLSFQNAGRKPPGLELDAVSRLQREVFKDIMESDPVLIGSLECSICLEKFSDGDGLIRLSCSHRFHPTCLIPWIRTRGDCPYCRAIVMGESRCNSK